MEINWEFDAKDAEMEKYGNFSSPNIIKLVSKYNKQTISQGKPANATEVAIIIAKELNRKLEEDQG